MAKKLTPQQQEKFEEFFGFIDEKALALYLRRFAMEGIKMYIHHSSDAVAVDKEWISNGHYWIHEFCELLDPHLEKPE